MTSTVSILLTVLFLRAERLLAAKNKGSSVQFKPHTMFAGGRGPMPQPGMMQGMPAPPMMQGMPGAPMMGGMPGAPMMGGMPPPPMMHFPIKGAFPAPICAQTN